mmetsp:Transcript_20966/g.72359  ORF Transcript_20966/g.72359 Transcript_20966/m.72359 type:complete len:224 (+) Transcript_20966:393-1064(+)
MAHCMNLNPNLHRIMPIILSRLCGVHRDSHRMHTPTPSSSPFQAPPNFRWPLLAAGPNPKPAAEAPAHFDASSPLAAAATVPWWHILFIPSARCCLTSSSCQCCSCFSSPSSETNAVIGVQIGSRMSSNSSRCISEAPWSPVIERGAGTQAAGKVAGRSSSQVQTGGVGGVGGGCGGQHRGAGTLRETPSNSAGTDGTSSKVSGVMPRSTSPKRKARRKNATA